MLNVRVYISALTACTLAVLIVAGCSKPPQKTSITPLALPNSYVGNAACQECHTREFAEHEGSAHDMTLRFADAKSLGAQIPPTGVIASTKYEVARVKDRFIFRRVDSPTLSGKMDYAFGSGRIGMTFVSTSADGTGNEFRMSLAPKHKAWYLTPGQERRSDGDLGVTHDTGSMSRCFGCHSVAGSKQGVIPEPRFFGVGCESCHGPGGEHLDAVKAG